MSKAKPEPYKFSIGQTVYPNGCPREFQRETPIIIKHRKRDFYETTVDGESVECVTNFYSDDGKIITDWCTGNDGKIISGWFPENAFTEQINGIMRCCTGEGTNKCQSTVRNQ